ncbi:protein NYNRIN-like [Esox lucius]|uniref:protein NYNRIN-like n=1 Tax=Esox lucius TaxID=8010 RepID=UPI0009734500|nr:protein NYNRIN-like [Esox lucius]XP_019897626.1 protein NYNRIN-like [Esox lucius]
MAAKAAATSPVSPIFQMVSLPPTDVFSRNDVSDSQSGADTLEVSRQKGLKCSFDQKLKCWVCPSSPLLPHVAKLVHGQEQVSKGGVVNIVLNFWFAPRFSLYAKNVGAKCVICMSHNVGRGTSMSAHPRSEGPFEHLMMDFNELTPCQVYNYCLVKVDAFYKWVEAFPCKHATAIAVAKNLILEIIPRWGLPSENGSHFVNSVIECISTSPKTDPRTHCSYHPASGGLVDRANQLSELMAETGLSWVTVMPLALMYMRGREHHTTGLSPHEEIIGRPMRIISTPFPQNRLTLKNRDGEFLTMC